ncbi:hypothetical protein [Streptomyces sp. NBC_00670]|uniref:hypothetical protein n=1 Tax=Streptomyces sp. NBC_00670 TaxID=2975804 RepID=UPI002E316498|nr:hypothetical protein [Streptomyces sp. NBC_00670]
MEISPENPQENQLGAGVKEEDLLKAVTASGYPLQSVAVDSIASKFVPDQRSLLVQEEWSYIDEDTGEFRNLDAYIDHEYDHIGQDYIRPHLTMLVECKQSELPFVFFLRQAPCGDFPRLIGMPHQELGIRFADDATTDAPITIGMRLSHALGLSGMPFSLEPPRAIAMSKAVRKSGKIELTGEETFRGIALPLMKAFKHFSRVCQPKPKHCYYDVRAVFPVAVVRAPMIGVHVIDGEPKMTALPWVRVVRVEPSTERLGSGYSELYAMDVVHQAYLSTYTEKAQEACQEIFRRMELISIPVITGIAMLAEDREGSGGLPYESLRPHVTDEEFTVWMRKKLRAAHG